MEKGERRFLTVEEFRERCPIGRTLAYELLRRGEIRSVSCGRRLLVPVSELDRLERRALGEVDPEERAAS